MIAAYHTHYGDRVRGYNDLAGMVTDGFSTTEPAYLAAAKAFSQNPRPTTVKIGRRANPPVQSFSVEMLDGTIGDVTAFSVGGTAVTYTGTGSTGATGQALAAFSLQSSIAFALGTGATGATVVQGTGATGATSTRNIVYVTATGGGGQLFDLTVPSASFAKVKISNRTPDPGVVADLTAIAAFDNDWYGLALDSNSSAEVTAAAVWVEANKKLAAFDTSDSACYDVSLTSDVMSVLQAAGYTRSGVWYNEQLLSYEAAAICAQRLTSNPGSDTWANKSIAGVTFSNISEPQAVIVKGKGGNVYIRTNGINLTLYGQTAAGQYYDTVRFIDWLGTTAQVAYLSLLANSAKIPFTDEGGDLFQSVLQGVMEQGVLAGGLAKSPAPTVVVPKVATITLANRLARNFTGIVFNGTLAGAVHSLQITGNLSS